MSSQTGNFNDYSSGAIGSASATAVAAANPGRQYLLIQNLSDVAMYVRITAAGTAAATGAAGNIYLAANGGSIIWEGETYCPNGAVSVIATSVGGPYTNKVVTVLEG